MSRSQSKALFSGNDIKRLRVFRFHPNTVFVSLNWPSAQSFLIDITSFLGITSKLECGLNIVRIAKGIARITLMGASAISGAIPIESSMYISIFPLSLAGISTDSSLA
jgi:hypothetical protein